MRGKGGWGENVGRKVGLGVSDVWGMLFSLVWFVVCIRCGGGDVWGLRGLKSRGGRGFEVVLR